jgi:hypothetical protein
MKNSIMVSLISLCLIMVLQTRVHAAPQERGQGSNPQSNKEMLQNKDGQKAVSPLGLKAKVKAARINGTVTAKGSDMLTVLGNDGKTYTVKVNAMTQWRRKFWGKSNFEETSVNDALNIQGKWATDEMIELNARLIRNISIQKRNGVFFGTVKSVSSTGGVTLTTAKRGDQVVTITSSTQIIDRKQTGMSVSSLLVGHKIRVKGLWDSKNNTITEVTQVKDFDVPLKLTPTPKQ